MTKLAQQFNWLLHDRPFSDWLRLQPSDYQAPPWSNKWGENLETKTMAKELRTTKHPDGTGFSEVIHNGERSVAIHWRGDSGVAPSDVIRLTLNRLEDEQRGGPFADPKNAKAIVLLMQAEAELNGTQANVDGVPVIGE